MNRAAAIVRRRAPSVIIGLSSGVDSTVAAWLLQQQGYNVIAVTFALADQSESERSDSCCSPSLMTSCRAIADHLGIPHYAVDLRSQFCHEVVEYFVSEYASGRTPNPCSKCNARVRFSAMADLAGRLGAGHCATGHYARLTGRPRRLSRGRDTYKDQSYVLAEVDPGLLSGFIFPLGGLTKAQVRAMAVQIGVGDLVSNESQEVCFVGDAGYRGFLQRRLGARPGDVVDQSGRLLGAHTGTYNYTIGQRKGLGHAGDGSLFVTRLDAGRAEVVVAPQELGRVTSILFDAPTEHRTPPRGRVWVQFRSMGSPLLGRLRSPGVVALDEPAFGVAPGQTLVVYHGDKVVLGATISSTGAA